MNIAFKYPEFLWASFLVLIPIIVHLFNFKKYKVVYFSNIKLLKNIQLETKSSSVLKHLLVLLTRVLFILALVLLFSHPYFPMVKKVENRISIVLDNSFSMNRVNENGRLLDNAKRFSLELVNNYGLEKEYQIQTQDLKPEHYHSYFGEDLKEEIASIEESGSSNDLTVLINRIKNQSKAQVSKVFVFSDFQRNNISLDKLANDSLTEIVLVPLSGNEKDNLFIDSVWFEDKVTNIETPYDLIVRLRNEGEKDVTNLNVNLWVDSEQKGLSNTSILANNHADVKIGVLFNKFGVHHCKLSIEDSPIKFDNSLEFILNIEQEVKVLEIYEESSSDHLKNLVNVLEEFTLDQVSIGQIEYDKIARYKLIILNGVSDLSSGLEIELQKFVGQGRSICIIPGQGNSDYSYLNKLMQLNYSSKDSVQYELNSVDTQSPFFKKVFNDRLAQQKWRMPVFKEHLKINELKACEVLLSFENEDPFLLKNNLYGGSQYLFTSFLDSNNSNFNKHGLMVPVFIKMMMDAKNQGSLYSFVGELSPIDITDLILDSDDLTLQVMKEDKTNSFIPTIIKKERRVLMNLNESIREKGIYTLYQENDEKASFALNYNRKESVNDFLSLEELDKWSSNYSHISILEGKSNSFIAQVSNLEDENNYFHFLLILSILLLFSETLLIRLL